MAVNCSPAQTHSRTHLEEVLVHSRVTCTKCNVQCMKPVHAIITGFPALATPPHQTPRSAGRWLAIRSHPPAGLRPVFCSFFTPSRGFLRPGNSWAQTQRRCVSHLRRWWAEPEKPTAVRAVLLNLKQ